MRGLEFTVRLESENGEVREFWEIVGCDLRGFNMKLH